MHMALVPFSKKKISQLILQKNTCFKQKCDKLQPRYSKSILGRTSETLDSYSADMYFSSS